MGVKGSSALTVASLYLRTLADRNAVSMTPLSHLIFPSQAGATAFVDSQGFNPSPSRAGHFVLDSEGRLLEYQHLTFWRQHDSTFAIVAPCTKNRGWCVTTGAVLGGSHVARPGSGQGEGDEPTSLKGA